MSRLNSDYRHFRNEYQSSKDVRLLKCLRKHEFLSEEENCNREPRVIRFLPMCTSRNRLFYLFYALMAATAVYLLAHWSAIANQYVINDDVRQQIYWMQSWSDPELYQDDLLSRYARNYVPWGVQAVYALGSQFMNPVQFTKVVAALLFVMTAGFLFGIGLLFKDDLTGVLAVCVFFLFGTFLDRISGGLSRGFVYPLMAGYVFFLGRENLAYAGIVLLLQSLFNPYAFLVCLLTHVIFIAHKVAKTLSARPAPNPTHPSVPQDAAHLGSCHSSPNDARISEHGFIWGPKLASSVTLKTLVPALPVALGVILIALKYAVFTSSEFGEVVTLADMAGRVEYTDAGRYGIVPVPSILFEIVRPWVPGFASGGWEAPVGALVFTAVGAAAIWALKRNTQLQVIDVSGFRAFFYLLGASMVMYGVACFTLMKLFLPSRYLEFSLNIFYCVLTAVCIRIAIEHFGLRRCAVPVIATVLVVFGAVRLHNVGLYDYSDAADIYRFLQSTPKTSLIAGHPDMMDNVTTFGKRKAFITYELSHTWYKQYWKDLSRRTFDFFRAYYSDDPDLIRKFCRKYGIDYLVVRETDFQSDSPEKRSLYFEPFGSYIRDLVNSRSGFAILDEKEFPPIFRNKYIRILHFN